MTDRVSAIGGKLVIDTAPGRGNSVNAVVEADEVGSADAHW